MGTLGDVAFVKSGLRVKHTDTTSVAKETVPRPTSHTSTEWMHFDRLRCCEERIPLRQSGLNTESIWIVRGTLPFLKARRYSSTRTETPDQLGGWWQRFPAMRSMFPRTSMS